MSGDGNRRPAPTVVRRRERIGEPRVFGAALAAACGVALLSAGACSATKPPPPAAAPADTIGMATQEADGTLVLTLRAEGPEGLMGDAQFRYAPTDKDYPMIARHVGPIPRGGSVLVRPFE